MFSIDPYVFSCVLLLVLVNAGPILASENDVDDTYRRVVLVGTNLKLPCSPPDAEDILEYFTWSKNGVLLPDRSSTALQSRFIIQSDFSLLIERVAEDDEGNYSCSVQSHTPRKNRYSVLVEGPYNVTT
ncbi:uncharacterized protein LOC132087735 [Daphnia carinata]|uniref:uncharacterized protein LOC132087735 n=1 Tax=Daphnia carinata TaxID=120202 RepID=UPI0028697E99|nr:uncharacterized protein LOC132087735 [Daphnia carinata]